MGFYVSETGMFNTCLELRLRGAHKTLHLQPVETILNPTPQTLQIANTLQTTPKPALFLGSL